MLMVESLYFQLVLAIILFQLPLVMSLFFIILDL